MEKEYLYIENENGEELSLVIERSFFYNGEEYALLTDEKSGQNYVMKVEKSEEAGENMEDFIPIDEGLEKALLTLVMNKAQEDEE